MIGQLLFIFPDAAIELVDKTVYRGIHIFFGSISINLTAVYRNGCFRLMP